jgi:hypothetical protein
VPALPRLHDPVHRHQGLPAPGQERKRREKDGLELTPIGANGYFIPIQPATSAGPDQPKAENGPSIRACLTEPCARAQGGDVGLLKWLLLELRDHLWPWSREGWRSQRALQVAGLLAGDRRHGGLGAWRRWAPVVGRHHRLVVRLERVRGADPPVGSPLRQGWPVVARNYRAAGVMDMMSYVGFKNLLIGAALFLVLKALGCAGAMTAPCCAQHFQAWRPGAVPHTRRWLPGGHPERCGPATTWRPPCIQGARPGDVVEVRAACTAPTC